MDQRIVVRYKTFQGKVARGDRTRHGHIEESAYKLSDGVALGLVTGAIQKIVATGQADGREDLMFFGVSREGLPFTADGESLQVVVELDRNRCEALYEARDELREAIAASLMEWVASQWLGDFESVLVDLRFISSCGVSARRDRRQVYAAWGGKQDPAAFSYLPSPSES